MFEFLIGLFVVGAMIDLYLTIKATKEGIFAEANPIFKGMVESKKFGKVVKWKLVLTIFSAVVLYVARCILLGRIGIVFAVLVQVWIIWRHHKYRKTFQDELERIKNRG